MLNFFVQKKKVNRKSCDYNSHDKPKEYPSFVLVQNDGWNDYGAYTWFSLFYYDINKKPHFIGDLKLMHDEKSDTYEEIKNGFNQPLNEHFCSLGIDTRYYYNITKIIDNHAERDLLLTYLRDCTYNTRIFEDFHNHERFKDSLFRDMSSQEAYNAAEFILNSDNPNTAFSFNFTYHPIYDVTKVATWEVSFMQTKPPYLRTIGIIGENGVGKTMLLTNFVKALLQNNLPETLNQKPHFQNCIAICSSERDGLLQIQGYNNIHYQPCCIKQKSRETYDVMFEAISIIMQRPMLYGHTITKMYCETLKEHIGEGFIDNLFSFDTSDPFVEKASLNKDNLNKLVNIFSSGQLQVFEIITYLYAYLHLSSLVIFDEPEVHLHPSLIMNFMPLLNRLLKEFKSFAIICTHTPLVVRELVQQNVYRMSIDTEGNPSINRVAFRTFGEDISILYQNIFEYNEYKSYFRQTIKQMVIDIQNKHSKKHEKFDRQKYIDMITTELSENMELGLSGKCTIRDVVYEIIA